jgi:glyoxylase-like metal-dependent hydrolase (beta-lactamase superfamily II)
LQTIIPGLSQISLGCVNAFLLGHDGAPTLIDTGVPGSEGKILAAVKELGLAPRDIKNILVTQLHADHAGSLKALKERNGAPAWIHPEDAQMVRKGETLRPLDPRPGIIRKFIAGVVQRRGSGIEHAEVEHELSDGEHLDFAGGARVIHIPGHAAGQVALLFNDQVLIVADAASNLLWLGYPPIIENFMIGRQTLSRLAELEFEVAVFGHGKPIYTRASDRFRDKWSD